MSFLLAHDLGTTGNKANLFDETGALIASHTEHYEVSYPQPAWAEQDADAWWRAVAQSTQALLNKVPHARDAIAAVSFSGQMMGVVPVDARGNALRSCIIWADQRATHEADDFVARCGADAIYASTGHRASAAYTAAKMLWLKRHQPEIYAHTHKFLYAKDFCVLKLTGECVTDYSDASGSTLFDLESREWRLDFVDALGLDGGKLPRVVSSQSVVGCVTSSAAAQTGLRVGTPVVIGGGDGACATIGAGCVEPGEAYCVLGTSSWIAMTTYEPILDAQMRTFTFHNLPANAYMPTGTMQAACASRDWLLRVVGAEVADEAVANVPAGARGLIFLPYLMGERSPWWNPKARGTFVGLSMVHDKAEMMRAVLEGVAFNLKVILEAFKEGGASIPTMRLIGGGAQSRVWQQILADVWNMPIHLPELLSEATSWGAAVAGGVGVGVYADWSVAKTQTRIGHEVEPNPAAAAFYAQQYVLFKESYLALEPVYNKF
jgi:xylulokinase